MKFKYIVMLQVTIGMQNLVAMHADEKLVAMEIDQKGSSSQPDCYEQLQQKYAQNYQTKKTLIEAMLNADIETIDQNKSSWPWTTKDSLPIKKSSQAQLTEEFRERLAFMKDKWPCSALWIALELVIKSKDDEESNDTYQKRLAILRIVVAVTYDWEPLPLGGCGWLCCLISCMCMNTIGYPMSRAAQANNIDAFKILLERFEPNNDNTVCFKTLLDDALAYDAQEVAEFLATREVRAGHVRLQERSWGNCFGARRGCLACCGGTITKRIAYDLR